MRDQQSIPIPTSIDLVAFLDGFSWGKGGCVLMTDGAGEGRGGRGNKWILAPEMMVMVVVSIL